MGMYRSLQVTHAPDIFCHAHGLMRNGLERKHSRKRLAESGLGSSMDRWMCRTIITRARVRTSCVYCSATGGSLNRRTARQQLAHGDTHGYRVKNDKRATFREYGARTDHLRPLERWLRSRIGEDWNVLWSEACQIADRRSLPGWHLRQHLEMLVETERRLIQETGFRGFYVDPRSRKLQYK